MSNMKYILIVASVLILLFNLVSSYKLEGIANEEGQVIRLYRDIECEDFSCGIRCLEKGHLGGGHCDVKGKCVCGTTQKGPTKKRESDASESFGFEQFPV